MSWRYRYAGAGAHAKLQRLVLDALEANRVPCRAIAANPKRRITSKMPDVVGAIPPTGRLFALEFKVGADELRPGQRDFFSAFDAAGALCIEVRQLGDLLPLWHALESGRRLREYVRKIEPPPAP